MTSGGLGLTESLNQDIGQEELDFSDLFLYNTPGDDFKGVYEAILQFKVITSYDFLNIVSFT